MSRYQEIAVVPEREDQADALALDANDAAELVEQLAQLAAEQTGQPEPIAAGSFVLYPMPDGGMMFVTSVENGPLAGIKHSRISPPLIRAMGVLVSGGSKVQALRAMMGRGKAKEIEGATG